MKKLIILFCFSLGIMSYLVPSEQSQKQGILKQTIAPYIASIKKFFYPTAQLKEPVASSVTKPKISTFLSPKLTEIAERPPIAFYNASEKKLILKNDISGLNQPEDKFVPQKVFDKTTGYQFSPHKKYIVLQRYTFGSVLKGMVFGPERIGTSPITDLYDIHSRNVVISFKGSLITQQFSPQEKTLLLASTQLSSAVEYLQEIFGFKKPSEKESGTTSEGLPLREQKGTREILRYYLFDIASATMIAVFENIQDIHFTKEDELSVTYDSGTTKTVSIKRNVRLSLYRKIINIISTQPTIQIEEKQTQEGKPLITAMYDHAYSKMKVIITGKPATELEKIKNVISYQFSPKRKFLIINHEEKSTTQEWSGGLLGSSSMRTLVVDTSSGDIKKDLNEIITFTFNTEESRLLSLQRTTNKSYYQLIDTSSGKTILTLSDTTQAAFFNTSGNVVAIDENNDKREYNSQTGISIEQEKINKEAEALQKAEARQQQINKEEQEWQKIYEPESAQTQSWIDWGKSLFSKVKQQLEEKKALEQTKEREQERYRELPEAIQNAISLSPKGEASDEEFFDFPDVDENDDESEYKEMEKEHLVEPAELQELD